MTNIDSITVNRSPTSDKEVSNKKYVDDSIGGNIVLKFNQTLEIYLKVSVGIATYILAKCKKIQLTDTTVIKSGNSGSTLLPY